MEKSLIKQKFDSINVFLLNNVADRLKTPLKEVINLIIYNNSIYTDEKVENLITDLQNNELLIEVEKVSKSTEHVANELDKVSFGYGYVDFGRESIVYNGSLNKRIVVWEEVLENADEIFLQKVLAFLLDWYLTINEEAIKQNYISMSNAIKKNKFFEYSMLKDSWNTPSIGGFRLSILDKWCNFYSIGVSDIASSIITKQRYFFKRRAEFINMMLRAKDKNILDCLKEREKNNISYLYSLMPEACLKQIGFWGILFENADVKKFANYRLKRLNLEINLYKYISYLYYCKDMDNRSLDEVEEILTQILKTSDTFYNPDIKVDFR